MTQTSLDRDGAAEQRFEAYLDAITAVLGHAGRTRPARAYCMGLLLPGERKSIEPMAARLAPDRVQAAHQSLHHLVAKADWSDQAVLDVVRAHVLPAIERHGPIQYWIVDDTGFPKKGKHSVGVSRQYCGQLGKPENCQLAVTLSVANTHASLPIAFRLYLPETWANDPERRAKAGIPDEIAFQTKPAIALDQIRRALASRFAAVRVRPAHRDTNRTEPWPEEWLLAEWPAGEREPTKYFLSSLPVDVPLTDLVTAAKARWRIERDYQELKQEIGLGHYEGRGWRGFHHHASLCRDCQKFRVCGAAHPAQAMAFVKRSPNRMAN